jgi:outer membrane lipoprotein-sorting protein
MKLFAVLLTLLLSGCYALSNPQGAAQSVKMMDLKTQTYKATCNGAVEDWPNCYYRAKQTCPNGYNLKERIQSPVGGKRELVFQCNK